MHCSPRKQPSGQIAWEAAKLLHADALKLKVQGKSLDNFSSSSFQTSFSSQRSGSFSTSKLGGASMGSSSATLGLNTSKWYTILQ
eukprot:1161209-Pelagomonas_calceolata.AAC.4